MPRLDPKTVSGPYSAIDPEELEVWAEREQIEVKISTAHGIAGFGFASDLDKKLKDGTVIEDDDIRRWKALTERMLKYAEDSMKY